MFSSCDPATITAAVFVALIFLDIFRQEYKAIPVHFICGFFSVVLMSTLCKSNAYFFAWLLLLLPFIVLALGIYLRKRNTVIARDNYLTTPLQNTESKHSPAQYFM